MTRFLGYVAASLDGRIADGAGGLGWLDRHAAAGGDHGYGDFYAGIDALVMGRATFDTVRGFGDWPYPGKPAFVMTTRPMAPHPEAIAVPPDWVGLRARLAGFGRVWMMGGGRLLAGALAAGMLDDLRLFVMPDVLGAGPAVFEGGMPAQARLTGRRDWPGGVTELVIGFGD